MAHIEGKYLTISEETNALDFLAKAALFIKQTEQDNIAWKWVIISLHSALYGFAICACKGTNKYNVTKETKKGDKLVGFWEALELCQNPDVMRMLIHSKPLVLTQDQKKSLEFLTNELRNNFEHYLPKLWSIELHGLTRIAMDALDVIHFLALETGTYVNLDEAQRNKIELIVSECKAFLENTTLHKELQILRKEHSK